MLLPGVSTTRSPKEALINGLSSEAVTITIDGVATTSSYSPADGLVSMVTPRLDAVEEMTVTGAVPGSGTGRGSVQVAFTTRSGSNRTDGSVYHYWRDPRLHSNYFFNRINKLPRNKVILPRSGVSHEGGPIVIPVSTPTPRRPPGDRLGPVAVRLHLRRPRQPQRRRLRQPHDPRRRHQPLLRLGGRPPPGTPYNETVIYEAHVKGLTQLHPEVPEEHRGTYAGLAHPAVIEHLQKIGITAIELMPVHQFIQDSTLLDQGLRNYWGYNTLAFLAPHSAYAASGEGHQVQEFKGMVKAMHAAGIEVILDVVYNHTAEGNHLGPTLSFKGIDNAAYYRLVEDDQRYYMDYTGTGNSLNVRQPHSLQLIMDSLRYWVTEMHVDGFRFDLAATLAREFYDVDKLSTFFEMVQQDPVVSQVKLIAEPWDIGPGGYQVGGFPPLWTEWNGAYRDTVRDFWRGEPAIGDFASRLAGSADYYEHSGRRPFASINFVTAHDGFTLRDLVSYNEKHNDANGEDNNDGESHNRSWNHGAEGPTDDPEVLELRARAQRNFITTLLLSQGVPMLLHGDELGRTQQGNNNTYAQDSELSWVHWDKVDQPLVEFTAAVARLRAEHPTFRRKRFFTGTTVRTGRRLPPQRHRLARPRRHPDGGRGLAGRRRRRARHVPQRRLHPRHRPHRQPGGRRPLPAVVQRRCRGRCRPPCRSAEYAEAWDVVIDTGDSVGDDRPHAAGEVVQLAGRSVVVLRQHTTPEVEVDHSVAASIKAQSTNGDSQAVLTIREAAPRCASTRT